MTAEREAEIRAWLAERGESQSFIDAVIAELQARDKRQRYCAMDEFTELIRADGGDWSETEVLGDCAIVKVKALPATLATINAAPGFTRVPVDRLNDPLSTLTANQRQAIRQRLLDMGYTGAEITDALSADVGAHTLRDVFVFATQRRRKPRWDEATQTIILDGPVLRAKSIMQVEVSVPD